MKIALSVLFALIFSSTQMVFAQSEIVERHESVGNEEFKEALESGEYILLDTRTVEEYQEENIEGSKLVEYNGGDMDAILTQLPKDQKYLVYCAVGVRSKVAMERMKELGFPHVLELDKGIKEWK